MYIFYSILFYSLCQLCVCVKTTAGYWPRKVNECTSYGQTDVTLMQTRAMNSVVIHSLQLTTARTDAVQVTLCYSYCRYVKYLEELWVW